jgi:hypothetical protein
MQPPPPRQTWESISSLNLEVRTSVSCSLSSSWKLVHAYLLKLDAQKAVGQSRSEQNPSQNIVIRMETGLKRHKKVSRSDQTQPKSFPLDQVGLYVKLGFYIWRSASWMPSLPLVILASWPTVFNPQHLVPWSEQLAASLGVEMIQGPTGNGHGDASPNGEIRLKRLDRLSTVYRKPMRKGGCGCLPNF